MKKFGVCALGLGLVLGLCGSSASAGSRGTGTIVFARGSSTGQYDISVISPTGRQLRRLTRSCMWDWSPDRTHVVFARACGDGNFHLYVVGASGRGLRRLTRGPALDQWPSSSWSADGRSIVFMSNRGPNLDRGASLWVVSPVTGGLRRLTHSTCEDVDPDW